MSFELNIYPNNTKQNKYIYIYIYIIIFIYYYILYKHVVEYEHAVEPNNVEYEHVMSNTNNILAAQEERMLDMMLSKRRHEHLVEGTIMFLKTNILLNVMT